LHLWLSHFRGAPHHGLRLPSLTQGYSRAVAACRAMRMISRQLVWCEGGKKVVRCVTVIAHARMNLCHCAARNGSPTQLTTALPDAPGCVRKDSPLKPSRT